MHSVTLGFSNTVLTTELRDSRVGGNQTDGHFSSEQASVKLLKWVFSPTVPKELTQKVCEMWCDMPWSIITSGNLLVFYAVRS